MATAWTRLAGAASADPYFEWARRTDFRHFRRRPPDNRFPVIMELAVPAERFARGNWGHTVPPADWAALIRVPPFYREPPPELGEASFCTAEVEPEFFDRLLVQPALRATIRRVELALPVEIGPGPRMRVLDTAWPLGTVVTAVIDDGLPFAHERLRRGKEPRTEFLWNQDGPTRPPVGFGYGLELRKRDRLATPGMKSWMDRHTYAGLVDESEVYRDTGHLQYDRIGHKPLAARASHGAHVSDGAGGDDPAKVSHRKPLIGVQLPVSTTADTSGGSLARYVLDGMRYILQRTRRVPAVVNLSYGLIAGPHDGSSVLERGIDQLIELRNRHGMPFSVVLPAGNSYSARCHAQFRTTAAGKRMRWRVVPDDMTPSFLELWLPHRPAGAKARIRVRTPTGDRSGWITEGETWTWQPASQVLCEVIYHLTPDPARSRNMVLFCIAPTSSHDSAMEIAPAGTWEIEVRRDGAACEIDAWIQRDDAPYGYPRRGRQSRFEDEDYEQFDQRGWDLQTDNLRSYIKRDRTLSAIATGKRTVVVGGYRRQKARAPYFSNSPAMPPAKSSAAGPLVDPPPDTARHRSGPDALAMSERSAAARGVRRAGSRSGSTVAMDGTSVAAPSVTALIAEWMRTGQPHDRTAVQDHAKKIEDARPLPNPRVPRSRGGWGRI